MDDVAPYTALCDDCANWDDGGRCRLAPWGYTHPSKDDCRYTRYCHGRCDECDSDCATRWDDVL